MSSIELTPTQTTILTALTTLHREAENAVTGEEIAAMVDRNPGTVRTQMRSLKALQLVEGIAGPKGGINRPQPPTRPSISNRWTSLHLFP